MEKKCIPILPRGLAAILILTSASQAADWSEFRGPNGCGISPDDKPPTAGSDAQIYFARDAGFATCLDAKSGAMGFKEQLPGTSSTSRGGKPLYVSAVLENGHVHAVSPRHGVFVFASQPEFPLVEHNPLTGDDSNFNAAPALADRQRFLRSYRTLYCIESMQTAGAGKSQQQKTNHIP